MSGILAVYALVISVLIASDIKPPPATYSLFQGFMHMAAGLSVGLSGLAAGYAIGIVGDAVRLDQQHSIQGQTLTCTGCAVVHAAIKALCWHGIDFDFRGGLGLIRVSRRLRVQQSDIRHTNIPSHARALVF